MDYKYFSKHYNLIAVDLSEQAKLENYDVTQHISFIDRLYRNSGAIMFLIIEKYEETTF